MSANNVLKRLHYLWLLLFSELDSKVFQGFSITWEDHSELSKGFLSQGFCEQDPTLKLCAISICFVFKLFVEMLKHEMSSTKIEVQFSGAGRMH